MIKEALHAVQRKQTERRITNLAPIVLTSGWEQGFERGDGIFWPVDLSRGKGKLTSGSTQPWLLLGACRLLVATEQIEPALTPSDDPELYHQELTGYKVTAIGELVCARNLLQEPSKLPADMRHHLETVSVIHALGQALAISHALTKP
ncbi:MAG: hypothetical protein ABIQ89_04285 [Candidatus Saccharimonadales bacterium]